MPAFPSDQPVPQPQRLAPEGGASAAPDPAPPAAGPAAQPAAVAPDRECVRPAVVADTAVRPPEVAADDPRLPAMAAEMAARFARYRRGVSTETFEHLVWEAARVRLRWPSGDGA